MKTTINLEKELKDVGISQLEEVTRFSEIDEVKMLLEHNSVKERSVLRNFNLDDSHKRVEARTGQLIEIQDFTKCYGNAYQLSAIGVLAVRYNMKFLPLNRFAGAIDPLLANKLLAFGEKHGIDPASPGAQDMFYVLAPAKDFKLETEVHETIVRKIVSRDPLLFYRGDTKDNNNREGQLWTLVHKWGTDLTLYSALRAIPFRNAKTLWVCNALAYSAVVFLIINLLIATYDWSIPLITFVSVIIGCLASCIRSGNINDSDEKNMFSELGWSDSRYHVSKTTVVTEYR